MPANEDEAAGLLDAHLTRAETAARLVVVCGRNAPISRQHFALGTIGAALRSAIGPIRLDDPPEV